MGRATPEQRFWRRVRKLPGIDGCWEWTGGGNTPGYGIMRLGGKPPYERVQVHRFSYALHSGEGIPSGLCVLHHCDNPPCVNPVHLFLGTKKDNAEDMVRKRRSAAGERHGMAKLDQQQVEAIFKSAGIQQCIADQYGISRSQVSNIKRGHCWGLLTGVSSDN